MSLKDFKTNLEALLLADTDLIAWVEGHFGAGTTLTVINSNRPVANINPKEMPALIFELDDGESNITVGNHRQDNAVALAVAIGWYEQNPDQAFIQRIELPDLMITALMRDHTLSGAVDGAWIDAFNA
ncbi:MAG: hypothetical protein SV201_14910, partial [Pseudomonadota bacterium]|nr:hypothetical protein [Pseudomonadota bacterium]